MTKKAFFDRHRVSGRLESTSHSKGYKETEYVGLKDPRATCRVLARDLLLSPRVVQADLSTPALNDQKQEMSSFANSHTLRPSVTHVQRGSTLGRWENWMGRPAGTSTLHFTSFSSIKANLSQLGHLLLKF